MAKKSTPKKTPAKKSSAKAAPKKKLTKTALIQELVEKSTANLGDDVNKKTIQAVLDALTSVIEEQVGEEAGPGEVTLPGLLKIRRRKTKGRPAGEYPDPFTKEMKYSEERPPKWNVKALPLKGLKDMVADLSTDIDE